MDVLDHDAAAKARLAQFLRGKPHFYAVLEALTASTQALEAAFHELLEERDLNTAVGAELDHLGALVGQARESFTEAQYRQAIRTRIKINRASGTIPELLEIFELMIQADPDLDQYTTSPPTPHMRVRDEPPAAFTLVFNGYPLLGGNAEVFIKLLRRVKAAGVRALIEYFITIPSFQMDSADPSNTFDSTPGFRGTLI